MASLATLEFRPSPVGGPKTASLDAVRRALETAGLISGGDRFLTKDLVEIASDAESKHTLATASKEAAGGLRVLTLRFGPKTSAVNLVKGEASWNLMPDVTQPLASFRNDLAARNLMGAADVFWMKGGPVLDESGFSIEQALDEQGVLAIGPPGSQGSQTILIAKGVKPENLKSLHVDLGQNLGQLRTKLEADNWMTKTDKFAGSDGAAISQSAEAGRRIKDAVGANKLLTITAEGWI
jgi:hypothetical protein